MQAGYWIIAPKHGTYKEMLHTHPQACTPTHVHTAQGIPSRANKAYIPITDFIFTYPCS
jgi:hypothetical protein